MEPHVNDRTNIWDDEPELGCPWDDNGKECPNPPAIGELFCLEHLEAGEADPAEYLRQKAAAEYQLDQAGHLT